MDVDTYEKTIARLNVKGACLMMSPFHIERVISLGKIFDVIDKQIKTRVEASYVEGFSQAKEDIEGFYIQGVPKIYERTGAYGDSPNSTPPSGGNGNYHYNIRLDDPEYHTGTYDGHTVLEQAQFKGSGILGRAGTWYEAEEDIKKVIMENFGK